MSKVKPEILSPPNPVGIDNVIADLQSLIAGAEFVNSTGGNELYFAQGLLLPLAFFDEKTSLPIVYWKDKDYYPATPNDNYRTVAFFYQEDPNTAEGLNESLYQLNLVVWFNQDLYVRNKNFLIKEYFIEELRVKIRNYLRNQNKGSISVFRENDTVFSRYTLSEKTRLKYPYQSFRISFQISAEYDCKNTPLLNIQTL